MRYLRVLALCLTAVFALSATTLVVASPAFAGGKCNQECKEVKEKEKKEREEAREKAKREREEAKRRREEEKFLKKHPNGGIWEKFYECPTELGENISGCIAGAAGTESFFQAGKLTVYFVKPVTLQIGFLEEESGEFRVLAARNGESISREAEPAPRLTEGLDAEFLPEKERTRYEEYLAKGGSTKVTETVELAEPASDMYLNEDNLLEEAGEGFGFPIMIHIENKFLGSACYDGTTGSPIMIPFTTGETHPEPPNTPIHGTLGSLSTEGEGTILRLEGQHLVNNEYAAPGVAGCGQDGGADGALDAGLGLPSPAGSNTTELVGTLYQAGAEAVRENVSH